MLIISSVNSVTQLCLTLCNPMDCSMPGFPVHHQLPEFAQTLVHWVSDAIQQSHPLSSPPLPSILPSIKDFSRQFFASGDQSTEASVSASVLPMNIQDSFLLGLTGWISLLPKGLSRVFSSLTIWKYHSLVLSLLYGSTLTSVHDYWKNHSFDYMDFSW